MRPTTMTSPWTAELRESAGAVALAELRGQVRFSDHDVAKGGVRVAAVRDGEPVAWDVVDWAGRFRLLLPPGAYEFVVAVGERAVVRRSARLGTGLVRVDWEIGRVQEARA